jgi:hypothetical protein
LLAAQKGAQDGVWATPVFDDAGVECEVEGRAEEVDERLGHAKVGVRVEWVAEVGGGGRPSAGMGSDVDAGGLRCGRDWKRMRAVVDRRRCGERGRLRSGL